jgi:hypothetical protein
VSMGMLGYVVDWAEIYAWAMSHPVLEGKLNANQYVLGSEIHIHKDYIIRHHHIMLKIIAEISTLLHHDVRNIHKVINLNHNQSAERNAI